MLGSSATTFSAALAAEAQASAEPPIKVMVVDDSAVVRGLVSRWIEEEPGMVVVARHPNGKLAVEDIARSAPDLVLLDIEMPVMDGLQALPLMLRARPEVRVLMVSTLTKRNAEISFKALSLGALDYVPKPDTNREITIVPDFHLEVIRKIRALGRARPPQFVRSGRSEPAAHDAPPPDEDRGLGSFTRRPFSLVPPRVIAIGASTGGPQALTSLLGALSPSLARVPVLVAQHMPPMFTTILAERLERVTGRKATEGVDGEPLKPGAIYVAPGDHHMRVEGSDTPSLRISDEPPVHFCRPAVDPLFQSVAIAYGPAALGVVLTGLGNDGARGARAMADAGGSVIAQDEASSAVWGMPAAAALAGACAAMLPPVEIAQAAARLMRGERS